jgi:hypothetical protein
MIEVVKYRDLIEVNSIPRFVPGMAAPTIEVRGEDFSSVEIVRINDVDAKEFMIINKTTMWVVLPDAAQGEISTVEVISGNFTRTAKASKLMFQFGTTTRKVSGLLSLTQLFTKWLLTSPGSDIFNVQAGGGLQNLVGRISSSRNMEPVITSITQSIDRTSEQIRTMQTQTPGLNSDEKLLSAELIDYGILEDRMEARIRIRLRSFAGDAAVTNLSL